MPERTRKANSPTAPGMPLSQAVADVMKAYQRYGHGNFSKGELANALGMSAGGGAFFSRISTLREYGLVADDARNSLTVTELFLTLYSAARGSEEMRAAALDSIGRNEVFRRLMAQFPARIPDEKALSLRLQTQERFNPDRSRVVATALRTSLLDFDLIDASGNVLTVRPATAEEGPAEAAPSDVEAPGSQDRAHTIRVEVPLPDDRRAVLILPADVTTAEVRKISAVLGAIVG